MDPYKILGIDKDASPEEIRLAYRKQAAKYHPDKGGDVWIFQQIQAAYHELTGKTKKKAKKAPDSQPSRDASKPETNKSANKESADDQRSQTTHNSDPFSSSFRYSEANPNYSSKSTYSWANTNATPPKGATSRGNKVALIIIGLFLCASAVVASIAWRTLSRYVTQRSDEISPAPADKTLPPSPAKPDKFGRDDPPKDPRIPKVEESPKTGSGGAPIAPESDGKSKIATTPRPSPPTKLPSPIIVGGEPDEKPNLPAISPPAPDVEPLPPNEILVHSARFDKKKANSWQMTVVDPGSGWTSPRFDDTRWQTRQGGFGKDTTSLPPVSTIWTEPNIWLRSKFRCRALPKSAIIEIYYDEDAEIYINGNRIKELHKFVTEYKTFRLQDSQMGVFVKGDNVLAVHCRQTVGWQFIDVGLKVEYQTNAANGSGGLSSFPPPRLFCPFSKADAKVAQRAWADCLKVDTEKVDRAGVRLVLIPPGEFVMGEDNGSEELFPHDVIISRPYYMGVHEITQGQWKTVMKTTPWNGKKYVKTGDDYPASHISWDDAVAFCQKLSQMESRTYRLPTEAEWEYACRAGTDTTYYFGNDAKNLSTHAWWGGFGPPINSVGKEHYAHRVGQKRGNAFDLFDMHGNVHEWCSDWYDKDFFKRSPIEDPAGGTGTIRVCRGGSWNSLDIGCGSARRVFSGDPTFGSCMGFRIVCEVK